MDKIINNFKALQQDNSNNNYQININSIKNIEKLETIMLNTLNNIKLENIENSDKSWSQNLPQMVLEDSFLNKDSSDEIFNQFLEKEKTFLTGVFINNRNTIEDMIINNKESNAQLIYNQKSKNNNVIPDGLVDSIIESEEIPDFFINKISEIIDSIGSDEKKI